MNDNYCCFQNATGISSFETELTDIYNASITYTNISSNNNITYTSNSSNQLFNNSSNSSNDNYKFTSNLSNLNFYDSNSTTSNVSNIYYNGFMLIVIYCGIKLNCLKRNLKWEIKNFN